MLPKSPTRWHPKAVQITHQVSPKLASYQAFQITNLVAPKLGQLAPDKAGGAPIGLRLGCPNYLPGDPHPNWPQPKLPKLPTRWHPNSPKTNFQKLRQNFMGLGRRFICHFTVFVSFAFEGRVSKGTNRNLTLCRTWGQIEILQYDEQRTWGQIEILQCNGWRLS